jgi:hypothetical protein
MAKLGRNEPCHCGSGRKYKVCCQSKDAEVSRQHEALFTSPLLVDGESKSECEDLSLYSGGRFVSLLRPKIGPQDNHLHVMADGFEMQTCVLSRTNAGAQKFQMPEYADRGFTWYIRLSPKCGGGIIAYFKNIETAMEAMDFLKDMEMADANEELGLPTNDDLMNMRRSLAVLEWDFLPEASPLGNRAIV